MCVGRLGARGVGNALKAGTHRTYDTLRSVLQRLKQGPFFSVPVAAEAATYKDSPATPAAALRMLLYGKQQIPPCVRRPLSHLLVIES